MNGADSVIELLITLKLRLLFIKRLSSDVYKDSL